MGRYINSTSKCDMLPAVGKAEYLIEDGAIELFGEDIKFQPNLINWVSNGYFEAVLYCDEERQFNYTINPNDNRPKRWFIYKDAEKYAE